MRHSISGHVVVQNRYSLIFRTVSMSRITSLDLCSVIGEVAPVDGTKYVLEIRRIGEVMGRRHLSPALFPETRLGIENRTRLFFVA